MTLPNTEMKRMNVRRGGTVVKKIDAKIKVYPD